MNYQKYGLGREEAIELLREQISNDNLFKHCLATEAVMIALAERLGEDPDAWGLAGLLHDLDAETHPDLTEHTHETERILRQKGIKEEVIEAIALHNESARDRKRTAAFHFALAAGETITGLIIATALVYPDKRLASVKAKSVRKRMKDKRFAAGADREIIRECERLGLSLEEFCELCLEAMQKRAGELGL